ncbi:MAG: GNAT family N-acetyltransferase [Bacteroidales bacterium]|nr:GNAT family N-acetyltransferase [Bacteroidales bacterium]
MTATERYRQLCSAEGARVPLFQQAWWMDAVCHGKRWDVLLEPDADNPSAIVAAWPYLVGQRLGLRYVVQPQLTQFSGPWFRSADAESQRAAAQALIERIAGLKAIYFDQNLSPEVADWLPYHWAGYRQTTRYTYRFDDIADPEALFERFHPSQRQRAIASANRQLKVDETLSPAEFAAFHTNSFAARGQRDLLPASLIERVAAAAHSRNQGLTLAARTAEGRLVGALFTPYDERVAYALLMPLAPDAPRGTMPLLVWEALKRLASRCRAFDFEGSMDRGIEHSYRLYGARQVPYHRIYKAPRLLYGLV